MVPLSKRSVSGGKYVDNAIDLQKVTWDICDLLPKSYTFKISNELMDTAKRIVRYTQRADSVYIRTSSDCLEKLKWVDSAYGECAYFFAEMGVLYEKHEIKEHLILEWCEFADNEMDYLNSEDKRVRGKMEKLIKEENKSKGKNKEISVLDKLFNRFMTEFLPKIIDAIKEDPF